MLEMFASPKWGNLMFKPKIETWEESQDSNHHQQIEGTSNSNKYWIGPNALNTWDERPSNEIREQHKNKLIQFQQLPSKIN
jgi:hypothetical protein